LRIGDYLELNPEKEAELKTVAVFVRAEPAQDSSCRQELSPFDRAMMERSVPKTGARPEEEMTFPVSASLCLSNSCTHNCSGCAHASDRRDKNAFLDADSFDRLLSCLRSLKVEFVDLRGGGEPTTHPEFRRFAQMCVNEGFDLSLLTNCASLDSQTTRLLVDGFSFLIVNLDASNDEVYDRIHRPPDPREFQKVLANIDRVVHEKKRGESKLTVGAQVRLRQANVNFMEQITRLAGDTGVDYIQFRIDQKAPDALLPDQIDQVNRLIPELRHEYAPFPVHGDIESPEPAAGGCSACLSQLVVNSAGDVYPCPHFAKLPQETCLGNVLALPPEELWFGARHKTVMQQLRQSDCPVRYCRWRVYGNQ
jgi:radical SAM protein with 4Fe4S-binding SPASM domain